MASLEGRAALHQAVDEGLVGGYVYGVPRNDFAQRRMPSRELDLEANFEIQFAQERSWLIVRLRSLSELPQQKWFESRWEGNQMVLSERDSKSVRFVRIERHVPCVGSSCDFIQISRE